MIRIETDATLDKWKVGLRGVLYATFLAEAASKMAQIGQEIFADADANVHVITGALKASGTYELNVEGDGVGLSIEYGGGEVDYAVYEFGRGGDHDALGNAIAAHAPKMAEVSKEAWDKAVAVAL